MSGKREPKPKNRPKKVRKKHVLGFSMLRISFRVLLKLRRRMKYPRYLATSLVMSWREKSFMANSTTDENGMGCCGCMNRTGKLNIVLPIHRLSSPMASVDIRPVRKRLR